MNKPEVVHIVETVLPISEDESITCIEENSIIPKCEPEAIIFQTLDENGFIHAQRGPLVMTSVPQIKPETSDKCYSAYSGTVDAGKQYSSTTIVGGGDVSEVCYLNVICVHDCIV
jgi:hypothetical protein